MRGAGKAQAYCSCGLYSCLLRTFSVALVIARGSRVLVSCTVHGLLADHVQGCLPSLHVFPGLQTPTSTRFSACCGNSGTTRMPVDNVLCCRVVYCLPAVVLVLVPACILCLLFRHLACSLLKDCICPEGKKRHSLCSKHLLIHTLILTVRACDFRTFSRG
jgi:hypothetical protein